MQKKQLQKIIWLIVINMFLKPVFCFHLSLFADVTLQASSYVLFLVYSNITESIISPSKFEISILFLCSMIVRERKCNSTENKNESKH